MPTIPLTDRRDRKPDRHGRAARLLQSLVSRLRSAREPGRTQDVHPYGKARRRRAAPAGARRVRAAGSRHRPREGPRAGARGAGESDHGAAIPRPNGSGQSRRRSQHSRICTWSGTRNGRSGVGATTRAGCGGWRRSGADCRLPRFAGRTYTNCSKALWAVARRWKRTGCWRWFGRC